MKKILIIRSANMCVIDKLIDFLSKENDNTNYELYVLIQKSIINIFKTKYPSIVCIEKKDGLFCYNELKKDLQLKSKLYKLKFDEIYMPSSCPHFEGFYETFMIASCIKSEKYILFNSLGQVSNVKLTKYNMLFNKYYKNFIYGVKIISALILIGICYTLYYPYFKLKKIIIR